MMAKYAQIREELEPPFLIEYAAKSKTGAAEESVEEAGRTQDGSDTETGEGADSQGRTQARRAVSQEPVEKKTAREVFEYVIEQGKQGLPGAALQGPGRDDRSAALGDDHGPGAAHAALR